MAEIPIEVGWLIFGCKLIFDPFIGPEKFVDRVYFVFLQNFY